MSNALGLERRIYDNSRRYMVQHGKYGLHVKVFRKGCEFCLPFSSAVVYLLFVPSFSCAIFQP